MLVLLVVAALAVLLCVVMVSQGRGGELTEFAPDVPPLELPDPGQLTAVDFMSLQLPVSLVGYHTQSVDETLMRAATAIGERDTHIAVLEQRVAELLAGRLQARQESYTRPSWAPDGEPGNGQETATGPFQPGGNLFDPTVPSPGSPGVAAPERAATEDPLGPPSTTATTAGPSRDGASAVPPGTAGITHAEPRAPATGGIGLDRPQAPAGLTDQEPRLSPQDAHSAFMPPVMEREPIPAPEPIKDADPAPLVAAGEGRGLLGAPVGEPEPADAPDTGPDLPAAGPVAAGDGIDASKGPGAGSKEGAGKHEGEAVEDRPSGERGVVSPRHRSL
ncbi:hypothetical protein [Sphaerisporangium corydalis]|uniref:DivIVA domain-containing protein n=1 Tax=Sphaerisporangium corydalis TaxID=1441875 RepID=A0ABV9ED18_9ACTN|nr:hypothetical protein [Sphaerisporangium corydalis]